MRVLGDKVLVEPTKAPTKTPGGLILPEGSKVPPETGVVIAVGPGKYHGGKLVPLEVKKGDKVLFGMYAGQDVKVNDKNYKIMAESEILGVIS